MRRGSMNVTTVTRDRVAGPTLSVPLAMLEGSAALGVASTAPLPSRVSGSHAVASSLPTEHAAGDELDVETGEAKVSGERPRHEWQASQRCELARFHE